MSVPTDLGKLSNAVKNDVVKKAVYNKLAAKVDNIDTSDFVLKTKYSTDKAELENKIPDTSGLVKKTDYNTKITEIENKIPDISNLATKTALTIVENKIPDISNLVIKTSVRKVEDQIPDISNLVKKANYDAKMTGINSIFNKIDLKIKELIKNNRLLSLGDILFNSDDGN